MWRRVRTLFILSTVILLVLPLSASGAIHAVVGTVGAIVAFAGVAWTGFNLVVVGARSAAFAQADEIWVSDPPNITRTAFDEEAFATSAAQWNIGHESSISIAHAAAPSGNAITVTAETKWEKFVFSPEINVEELPVNEDGVLWGQGFAYGTLEGIVTEKYDRWDRKQVHPRVAEIPLRYVISDIALPFEAGSWVRSFDPHLRAWKMDDEQTRPDKSSWHEQVLLASISLDSPSIDDLRSEGAVSKDDFLVEQDGIHIRLRKPVESEVMLRVPFPDDVEHVVIALRAEARGTFQVGKR